MKAKNVKKLKSLKRRPLMWPKTVTGVTQLDRLIF